MQRHKCKLCSRTFSNGRALGGHMKAHLATLPIPPKPHHQPPLFPTAQSSFSFSSSSSYSSESEPEQQEQSNRETEEIKGVPTIYGLRENPKKSFRFSDPEFSGCGGDGGSVLVFVQDRESETESKNTTTTTTTMMMMTRQRSKRNRKISPNLQNDKKPKLSFVAEPPPPPHATEPEPMVSSVSDASTEEDVAMCLMMLSRDTWKKKINNAAKQDQEHEHDRNEERDDEIENVKKVVRGKKKNKNNECEGCGKKFRSSRALGSHRSICCRGESGTGSGGGGDRAFECPFCFKIFGSGQALGGHKRSHLMGISATTSSSIVNNDSVTLKKNSRESFIDLNLPAPVEDDGGGGNDDGEFSAVSHISDA